MGRGEGELYWKKRIAYRVKGDTGDL